MSCQEQQVFSTPETVFWRNATTSAHISKGYELLERPS